jgi:hypothetical protein
MNLPLVAVTSFERVFTHRRGEYIVLFQGKTPVVPPVITQWCLVIPHHPEKGFVKYALEKRFLQWQRFSSSNRLDGTEEYILLRWASDVISGA